MDYCGFADEASSTNAGQIAATKALGWRWIESRGIEGGNFHDASEADFDRFAGQLADSGVGVACVGSAIANWSSSVLDGNARPLEQTARAIARMQRLGTRYIRIMSFKVLDGRGPDDQEFALRVQYLREIVGRLRDAGLIPVHENCMNYGGMGASYTLRLIEAVPGLSLVFDTGNPVFTDDRDRITTDGSMPKQSAWDFWRQVRDHVTHIHIKDGIIEPTGTTRFTHPGEGHGDVARILADALARGYDGFISIEPHLAVVHHDPTVTATDAIKAANYIEYGRRLMTLVQGIQAGLAAKG